MFSTAVGSVSGSEIVAVIGQQKLQGGGEEFKVCLVRLIQSGVKAGARRSELGKDG